MPPAYYADRLCERVRCYFHDFFNPTDPGLKDVGKGQDVTDKEIWALKRNQAWENRFNENGEKTANGAVAVPMNDHGPWQRSLDNTMFWL